MNAITATEGNTVDFGEKGPFYFDVGVVSCSQVGCGNKNVAGESSI